MPRNSPVCDYMHSRRMVHLPVLILEDRLICFIPLGTYGSATVLKRLPAVGQWVLIILDDSSLTLI